MDKNICLHEGVQKGLALPDAIKHRNEDGDLVCSDARVFSKVIASTDPFLNLPEISPDYLKLFCKRQPKEVLVEYCAIPNEWDNPMSNPFGVTTKDSEWELVLENNVLSPKNPERTYTTSEVLDIIGCVQADCAFGPESQWETPEQFLQPTKIKN